MRTWMMELIALGVGFAVAAITLAILKVKYPSQMNALFDSIGSMFSGFIGVAPQHIDAAVQVGHIIGL